MSEQEEFWRGEFGDQYTQRNRGEMLINLNMKFWRRVLEKTPWMEHGNVMDLHNLRPKVFELGAGAGLNLIALKRLGFYADDMTAVEVNHSACEELRSIEGVTVLETSALGGEFGLYDLVISSGFLIHIGSDKLERAYDVLYDSCRSKGIIVLVEYFASTPTPVRYRGHDNKLWRRNYGKDMLERFSDLSLCDYGFVADIDPECPRDNVNIWLLGKK